MHATRLVILGFALSLNINCGSDFGYGGEYAGGGGDYGVTPGGAQNIGYARGIIEAGGVPRAGDFPIEGLLSEHDIPSLGPACDSLLCLRPALGVGPDLATGELAYWVQLGMSSGLSRDAFVRPPLDVVVAIDKSASMSIDMDETNEAVTRLIDKLREDDRLAILVFDSSVQTIKELGPVGDREALKAQVKSIRAGGDWDLQAGTQAAYDILLGEAASTERLRRVMVFSCGYPAVLADGTDAYSQLVQQGAARNIGMSFFGVLLGYSPNLADMLGRATGGAFYYLESFERVVQVFDTDFDTMVTPVAYDMRLAFTTSAGFALARLYGVPGDREGEPDYEVEVATAFLSNRRGAVVARLDRLEAGALDQVGTVNLSYTAEPALGWSQPESQPDEQIEEIRVPTEASPDGTFYRGPGVRKSVALVNMGQQMDAACASYHTGGKAQAIATLDELASYLAAEAEALADPALAAEVGLVDRLIANMQ